MLRERRERRWSFLAQVESLEPRWLMSSDLSSGDNFGDVALLGGVAGTLAAAEPGATIGLPGGASLNNPTFGSTFRSNLGGGVGYWDAAASWSAGRAPTAADKVIVEDGDTLIIRNASAIAHSITVHAGGKLAFANDVDTELKVITLVVLGELEMGTEASPIAAHVTARLTIRNVALDSVADPGQWGNGLVVLGKIRVHGAVKDVSDNRLAVEPRVGHTTLTFERDVTGWKAGDKLFLPGTKQLDDWNYFGLDRPMEWENLTVASVSGKVVTLTSALTYDHLGARNSTGAIEFMAAVQNLSRNAILKSESATGTRGHTLFAGRADVDIRYAQFGGLGRSRLGDTSNFRLPVHFYHLNGPTTPQANGYQYTFIGNAITCPLDPMPFQWGLAINNSHYGLIQNNDLNNWAGAGLVTVTGAETQNVIEGNRVMRVLGTGNRVDEIGAAGAGFWFRGPDNYVRNNVAANIATDRSFGTTNPYAYGFNASMGSQLRTVTLPAYQGADPSQSGQSLTVNMNLRPFREFRGNEAFATYNGLTLWWLGTLFETPADAESQLADMKIWNTYNWGIFFYESNRLVVDNLRYLTTDTSRMRTALYFADYMARQMVIQDSRIENGWVGLPTHTDVRNTASSDQTVGRLTIKDTTIVRGGIGTGPPSSVNGSTNVAKRVVLLSNVQFQNSATTIRLTDQAEGGLGAANLSVDNYIIVHNYNSPPGVNGEDFIVQAPYRTGVGTQLPNRPEISGKIYSLAAVDATAPTLSNIGVSGITTTSATVSASASENAAFQVLYGETTAYGESATHAGFATSRGLALDNLRPNTTYHYKVLSWDVYGNLTAGSDRTFTTAAGSGDTTAPVISGVASSSVSTGGAAISWTTDEASSTQVEYGLTTSYGSSTTLNTSLVTGHSQTLSGLNPGTTYHYRVKSRDAAGNLATSADFTFTTSALPPTADIVDVSPDPRNSAVSSANVTFSKPVTGVNLADFVLTRNGNLVPLVGATLSGSGANYALDLSSVTGASGTYMVTLLAAGSGIIDLSNNLLLANASDSWTTDLSVPALSNVTSTGITSASASINWATNEASDTQIEYGTSTSYGNSTTLDGALVTSHSGNLAGLALNTTYHYRVKSRDAAGNLAISGDFTFSTAAIGVEPIYSYDNPKPLPASSPGSTVTVSTVSQLINAVNNLQSGQTISIAPGTYNLSGVTDALYVRQGISDWAIRGATGDRDDVIIKGAGMSGSVRYGFWTNSPRGTIADLTIDGVSQHGIIANTGAHNLLIHGVRIVDAGSQFVKSNPGTGGLGNNSGVVEYSRFEYRTTAPDNYANGVDIHGGDGWLVKNNLFKNFLSPLGQGVADPAVLIWNGSKNSRVEGNTFINVARGIAFGLVDKAVGFDHQGGVISNNMFYRDGALSSAVDVPILVADSPNTHVYHNTIIARGSYRNAIEYRFATSTGLQIRNNLTDGAIVSRDGATGTVSGNKTDATLSLFANPTAGDLHLLASASSAINQGMAIAGFDKDLDGQTRDGQPDLGADEFISASPPADTTTPTADIADISPDPRNSAVGNVNISFSENVTGVTLSDFTLTRNGAAVSLTGATLGGSGANYAIDLSGVTGTAGNYVLTLVATGSGIADAAGNALAANASDAWTIDSAAPTADIVDITPDPRNSAVGSVNINFSEPVSGVNLADFTLTRNGSPVSLAGATLSGSGASYALNLSGVSGLAGSYLLTLVASGSGIVDAAGNALSGNGSEGWTTDTTAPTADVVDISPDPRSSVVETALIAFSERVTGVDLSDFTLTRNGSPVSLAGAILSGSDSSYTLNLSAITEAAGTYVLTLAASGSGITDAASNLLSATAEDTWTKETAASVFQQRFDFGTPQSPVEHGFVPIHQSTVYDPGVGYGWLSGHISGVDQKTGAKVTRDMNYTVDGTFAVDLPDGAYSVSLTMGDAVYHHDFAGVYLEGNLAGTVMPIVGEYTTVTFAVNVTDGQLTLRLKDLGGSDPNVVINGLTITSASGQASSSPTIDSLSASPSVVRPGDLITLTAMGVSDSDGDLAGVKFYRDANQNGIVDVGTDPLVAEDNSGTDGWSATAATAGLADGSYAFLAFAIDQEGRTSGVATATAIVRTAATGRGKKFDFGTWSSPVEADFTAVHPDSAYDAGQGHGWLSGYISGTFQGGGTALTGDMNYTVDGTFVVDLPGDIYSVTVTMGDAIYHHDAGGVYLEGELVDSITPVIGEHSTRTYQVSVTDGQLTLRLKDLGGSDPNVVLNGLQIEPVGSTTASGSEPLSSSLAGDDTALAMSVTSAAETSTATPNRERVDEAEDTLTPSDEAALLAALGAESVAVNSDGADIDAAPAAEDEVHWNEESLDVLFAEWTDTAL